jgi:small-conductance mechanosensitive channel
MENINNALGKIWAEPIAKKAIIALVVMLVLLVAIRLVKKTLTRYVNDKDHRYRSRKMVNFVGYILAILAIVVVFSDSLGGIGVTLGVAGAGIAFALQEVIVSFAGWIALASGNLFKTGDRVEFGGIKGDVIDIGVLRSTIMETGGWVDGDLYNGRIVIVSNSAVFKEPIYNYSSDFPFLWDEIKVPIRYESDFKLARKILSEVAEELLGDYAKGAKQSWQTVVRKYLIEDAQIAPMVSISGDDSCVTFTVRYIVDFKRRRGTKDRLWETLIERIEATGDKVRISASTIEIAALPEIFVRNQGIAGSK